jgi:hypothetical protein
MQQMKGVVCFMREELSIFVFADHYTEQSKGSGWEHRRSITPVWAAVGNTGRWSYFTCFLVQNNPMQTA